MHINPTDGRWSVSFASKYLFQTYMFPFLNLGLEKPVSFSSSLSYSKQFLNNFQTQRADKTKVLTL
jgi:outer membrane protein insertion porin family